MANDPRNVQLPDEQVNQILAEYRARQGMPNPDFEDQGTLSEVPGSNGRVGKRLRPPAVSLPNGETVYPNADGSLPTASLMPSPPVQPPPTMAPPVIPMTERPLESTAGLGTLVARLLMDLDDLGYPLLAVSLTEPDSRRVTVTLQL